MRNYPSLPGRTSELRQQRTDAEDSTDEELLASAETTIRTEIVNGLRAELADVGRQLARSRASLITVRYVSDRYVTGSVPRKPDFGREHGIINEFIADADAELTLASVLGTFNP